MDDVFQFKCNISGQKTAHILCLLFLDFLQDLLLPLKVTASDIVSISGKKADFVERPSVRSKYIVSRPQTASNVQDEVTFLSSWQDKEKASSVKVSICLGEDVVERLTFHFKDRKFDSQRQLSQRSAFKLHRFSPGTRVSSHREG